MNNISALARAENILEETLKAFKQFEESSSQLKMFIKDYNSTLQDIDHGTYIEEKVAAQNLSTKRFRIKQEEKKINMLKHTFDSIFKFNVKNPFSALNIMLNLTITQEINTMVGKSRKICQEPFQQASTSVIQEKHGEVSTSSKNRHVQGVKREHSLEQASTSSKRMKTQNVQELVPLVLLSETEDEEEVLELAQSDTEAKPRST